MVCGTSGFEISGKNPTIVNNTAQYTFENPFDIDCDGVPEIVVYHDDFLFEGTGLYGESTIRRVDLETGEVLQIQEIPANRFMRPISFPRSSFFRRLGSELFSFSCSCSCRSPVPRRFPRESSHPRVGPAGCRRRGRAPPLRPGRAADPLCDSSARLPSRSYHLDHSRT